MIQMRAGRSLIDLVKVDGPIGRGGGPEPKTGIWTHSCLRVEPWEADAIRANLTGFGVAAGAGRINNGTEDMIELKGPPVTDDPINATSLRS